MLAIPFLIPSLYMLQAYSTTRVKTPLETTEATFFKTDKFSSFFNQVEIRKDAFVIKKYTAGLCEAKGTNFSSEGKAVISIDPKFYEVDQKACLWVMKHEVSHIKNNDNFTTPSVSAICSLGAAILSSFFLPVISVFFVTMIGGIVGKIIFSRYVEGKADDFAIANSTDAELKAGRRFIKASMAHNLELRKENGLKIFFPTTGNNRLDFLHPSATSRLKKIEDALEERHLHFDDREELSKINKLKILIKNCSSEMENKIKKIGLTGWIKEAYQ